MHHKINNLMRFKYKLWGFNKLFHIKWKWAYVRWPCWFVLIVSGHKMTETNFWTCLRKAFYHLWWFQKGMISFVSQSERVHCEPMKIWLIFKLKWNQKSENIKKAAVITESLKIPLFSIAIDGGAIQESNIGNCHLI